MRSAYVDKLPEQGLASDGRCGGKAHQDRAQPAARGVDADLQKVYAAGNHCDSGGPGRRAQRSGRTAAPAGDVHVHGGGGAAQASRYFSLLANMVIGRQPIESKYM